MKTNKAVEGTETKPSRYVGKGYRDHDFVLSREGTQGIYCKKHGRAIVDLFLYSKKCVLYGGSCINKETKEIKIGSDKNGV